MAAQGGTGGASTIIVGKGEGVGMSSRRICFLQKVGWEGEGGWRGGDNYWGE